MIRRVVKLNITKLVWRTLYNEIVIQADCYYILIE